jgi:hypothetical protein
MMDPRDIEDAAEYARSLSFCAHEATLDMVYSQDQRQAFIAEARQHLAQVAFSMGYRLLERAPMPSISQTVGDV